MKNIVVLLLITLLFANANAAQNMNKEQRELKQDGKQS